MNIPTQVTDEDDDVVDALPEPWRTQLTDPPDIRVEGPPLNPYQARHYLELKNGSRPRKQWDSFAKNQRQMKLRRAKVARRRNRKKR